jgi:CubicO group peptidase (beta-lactamase class C family)
MFGTADSHFQRTSPERQGLASSAILQFVEELERQVHEIHSLMLVRHNRIIAEGWWSPYQRERPHMLFSLSKSFTATAVGLAIAEGHFSLDDAVLPLFSEDAPVEASDFLARMRVRHLLSMTTGQTVDTWAQMVQRPDGHWTKGFFEVPVVHAPGTHFLYNSGASYMLSAIVQKTTGTKLIDYLTPRLFEPLGIEQAVWDESPQGIAAGGVGLRLKTEDVARFGQLYLQKGMWRGSRLLSEAWVAEATAAQVPNGANAACHARCTTPRRFRRPGDPGREVVPSEPARGAGKSGLAHCAPDLRSNVPGRRQCAEDRNHYARLSRVGRRGQGQNCSR